jgi:SAM-dependent methyltransferase
MEPDAHEAVSRIIRRYSTNRADVRRTVLDGIDLSRASRVLDLGCGFGFMIEALAGSLPADAEIIGIDMHDTNRDAFLARAGAVAGSARFECRTLDSHLDFATAAFDVVLASYSLYFFPGVVPEVARVLKPDGVFLTLTHSESHFEYLLGEIGFPLEETELHGVLRAFSAENGAERLSEHFGVVESRPYANCLEFGTDDVDDYLTLLRFKLPLLMPAESPEADTGHEADLLARSCEVLEAMGRVTIEKDDSAFVCREPLSP